MFGLPLDEDRGAPFGHQSAYGDIQRRAQLGQSFDGRVADSLLDLRQGLLGQSGAAGQLTNGQPSLLPEPSDVAGYELLVSAT
jgi:hypothetical protein